MKKVSIKDLKDNTLYSKTIKLTGKQIKEIEKKRLKRKVQPTFHGYLVERVTK